MTVRPKLMQRIRQDVQSMHSYAIQDSAGMVKLDAMENPYRLPADLQAALGKRLGALALNRYPDGRVNDLRHALAKYAAMPEGFDIMLGNGSDELISMLALACDVPGAAIVAPLPGFVMYAMSAQLQGVAFHGVPLTADFELDEAAMLAAIDTHKPSIVYLAYPNNPTGNLWNDEVIEKIILAQGAQGGLVVMDEAYQPFASKSYAGRITRHAHVLLMRTLSKFGLAGVRLGYMIGPKALVAEIDKVRPPYNISVLDYECALFALEHAEVFAAQAKDLREQRARLQKELATLAGVKAFPSEANMILVRVPDAAKSFDGLKAHGVLIKNVSKMHPLLSNCLRLTVGTAQENDQLLAALKDSL
ncbi:histidinol-phosphate transaminase [Limnohabitans sp. 2KL-17]|uniref:histidinol-phosphate transaminase n=1 Tax=Limnohabitans sp. 2KL-17 TaxID=1100704 RepID=UPI000D3CCA91|nr:histidinol-phosphate transaminase [Limnohabitans sp. 2KL-17]PUE53687.1 histidinol-phosphate transaminase [Limnohabitans sp. 2KL-17]